MQLWQLVKVALVPVSLKILVHVHPRLALQPGMTSCQGSGGLSFRAHRLDTCYSPQYWENRLSMSVIHFSQVGLTEVDTT